jgi:hypothetical protein
MTSIHIHNQTPHLVIHIFRQNLELFYVLPPVVVILCSHLIEQSLVAPLALV